MALLAAPFVVGWIYEQVTALPEVVVIGTGPPGGMYRVIMPAMAQELEARLPVKVELIHTTGALDNLRRLAAGTIDVALVQAGTQRDQIPPADVADVRFVANIYSEVTHFIVRRGSNISKPADLRGKRVSLGMKSTGNYVVSLMLLEHFGIPEDAIIADHSDFAGAKNGLTTGTLDAAFFTIGTQAQVFADLFSSGTCDLVDIPYIGALIERNISLSAHTIPPGLYVRGDVPIPFHPVETVALKSQLLTRSSVHTEVVRALTQIATDEVFQKANQLGELFHDGRRFA